MTPCLERCRNADAPPVSSDRTPRCRRFPARSAVLYQFQPMQTIISPHPDQLQCADCPRNHPCAYFNARQDLVRGRTELTSHRVSARPTGATPSLCPPRGSGSCERAARSAATRSPGRASDHEPIIRGAPASFTRKAAQSGRLETGLHRVRRAATREARPQACALACTTAARRAPAPRPPGLGGHAGFSLDDLWEKPNALPIPIRTNFLGREAGQGGRPRTRGRRLVAWLQSRQSPWAGAGAACARPGRRATAAARP